VANWDFIQPVARLNFVLSTGVTSPMPLTIATRFASSTSDGLLGTRNHAMSSPARSDFSHLQRERECWRPCRSVSQFKTMKYLYDFPRFFATVQDARMFL
jgi:hypothetical protein